MLEKGDELRLTDEERLDRFKLMLLLTRCQDKVKKGKHINLFRLRKEWPKISDYLHITIDGGIERPLADVDRHRWGKKCQTYGWNTKIIKRVLEGLMNDEGYESISEAVGKSEKAIRWELIRVYGTSSQKKLRRMLKEKAVT